jgi:rfaE bifunctional protein nucleotidyltransferase chain/domain/rfaE bifunctional protein kinase chain/domain
VNLVVVGDSLLDVDLLGSASRLCPDAPVPVLDLERRDQRPGGAGLAATLAAADGIRTTLVTALAEDDAGERLRAALAGLDTVIGPSPGPTPVKTRVRCAGQSLARIDQGGAGDPPGVSDEMLDTVCSADAVLVCDYGRGIARDPRLRDVLARLAGAVPVVWDPHPRGPRPVPGVSLVSPNLGEAVQFVGIPDRDPERVAAELRLRWRAAGVAVTMGRHGAVLATDGSPIAVPAPRIIATDTCGAGDRFASAAAIALMSGHGAAEAVWTAVHAAARFLADGGVSSVGRADVTRLPAATDRADARAVIEAVRARGGTVVATGGCFDLLHAGHIRTLSAARGMGDCLVVCLNSDRSVRHVKGARRPINTESDRAEVLRSLACVDAVAVFDEDTPEAILNELRPDVWVKGGDYSGTDELPEARLLRVWGGRTVLVPHHPGRSTTQLATTLANAG